jgi:Flp pilus assembly protein TadD/cell division protein FtsN
MNTHPSARHRFSPLRPATALALALALTACATGGSKTVSADAKSAVLLKVADDTRAAGDAAAALTLYRQLHQTMPADPVPLLRIGVTAMELANYGDAETAYRAALAITPNDADARRGLAMALLSEGKPEAALTELQAALSLRSDDARTYNALGVAHDMMGRYQEAQQDYHNGLKIAPTSASLRNNLGMSQALAGNYENAIATLEGLGGVADAPPRFRLNLALAYGLAGNEEKAASVARHVLDEQSVKNNIEYYAMLRAMDSKTRASAIISAQVHGGAANVATAKTPEVATAAPAAAPREPVEASTLKAPSSKPIKTASVAPSAATDAAAQDAGAPVVETADGAPTPEAVHPLKPHRVKPAAGPSTPPVPPTKPAVAASADAPAPDAQPTVAQADPMPAPADGKTADGKTAEAAAPTTSAVEPALGPPVQTGAQAKPAQEAAKPAAEATTQVADASKSAVPVLPPRTIVAEAKVKDDKPVADAVAPAMPAPSTPATAAAPTTPAAPEVAEAAAKAAAPTADPADPKAASAVPERAAAAGDHIVLQLGSYVLESSAKKVVDQCAAKGLEARVGKGRDANGRDWFVVRSAEYASADDAQTAMSKFREVAGLVPRLVHHRGATAESVDATGPAAPATAHEPHAGSDTTPVAAVDTPATTSPEGITQAAFTPKAGEQAAAPATSPTIADAPAMSAVSMAEIAPAAAPTAAHHAREAATAASSGDHVVLQLGSYQLESSARSVMSQCASHGIEVKLGQTHDREGRAWFIVRTADFTSADEAAPVVHQISAITGVTPIVLKHHTPAA